MDKIPKVEMEERIASVLREDFPGFIHYLTENYDGILEEYLRECEKKDRSTLGERVAQLRKRNRLTMDEMAKIIGVSKASIFNYEMKGVMPKYAVLRRMAWLFGVSVGWLIDGDNYETPD